MNAHQRGQHAVATTPMPTIARSTEPAAPPAALDDAIRQERHDRAAVIRAALPSLVRRPYTPGDTVPYSFCTAHWVLADESDTHCGNAAPEVHCHMVALVTGDPL